MIFFKLIPFQVRLFLSLFSESATNVRQVLFLAAYKTLKLPTLLLFALHLFASAWEGFVFVMHVIYKLQINGPVWEKQMVAAFETKVKL